MKKKLQSSHFLRHLLFLGILLIHVSCATTAKKESIQDLEKTKPTAAEVTEPSFVTKLKTEMLEDRSRIHIKTTGSIQYTAFKLSDPLRLILDISDMQLKPEAQEPIELNKGGINTISTHYFSESNITRVIIGLNQNVSHDINKSGDNELNVDIDLPQEIQVKAPSMETPEKPFAEPAEDEILLEEPEIEGQEIVQEEVESVTEKKKFTGQLISLDFQDADLKNILRLIAGISGFNIITSPEVKGTVTLRLMEVPWDQALDLILKNNQLGMQKEGNILRITTAATLSKEKEAEISAAELDKKKEDLVSKTVQISYADMTELSGILDCVKSDRGELKTDERTSTLIIRDIQSSIDEMMELIKILDKRTQQVSIEARIVEVDTNFSKELGIQWGGELTTGNLSTRSNVLATATGASTDGVTVGGLTAPNFLVDLPAAVGTGSGAAVGFSLGALGGDILLDVRLSALEDSGNGKILSSPRITTANHKEANIKSGTSIPYETVSSEGTQTQFVDAVISLNVTPHITPDGFIRLEIDAKKMQRTSPTPVQAEHQQF